MPNRAFVICTSYINLSVIISLILLTFSCTLRANSDITYQLPAHNYVMLSIPIASSEDSDADFANIELPIINYAARQPIVKGVIILIGDIHTQGFMDNTLLGLANKLPDWGWHTLLVTPKVEHLNVLLPEKVLSEEIDRKVVTSETPNLAQSNSSPNKPIEKMLAISQQAPELPYTYAQYENYLVNLLEALQTDIIPASGYQIIITKGKSAATLISVLSAHQNININAFVINSPYWPTANENEQIPNQLAELAIPVLDLVSLSDNQWSRHSQSKRLNAARVQLKSGYRQRELIGANLNQNQLDYIVKEVVGWTNYLGW